MNIVYVCRKCGHVKHRPSSCPKGHGVLEARCPNCGMPVKECVCN